MMRDKALTPGMSCWDMRGAGSGEPHLGGARLEVGKLGCGDERERRGWGWGTPNMKPQLMRTR